LNIHAAAIEELGFDGNRGNEVRQYAKSTNTTTDSIKIEDNKLSSTIMNRDKWNEDDGIYSNNTCLLKNRYSVLSCN